MIRAKFLLISLVISSIANASGSHIAGVTFADKKGEIYVSAREIAKDLNIPFEYDKRSDLAYVGSIALDYRSAMGDQRFISLSQLKSLGITVKKEKAGTTVKLKDHQTRITIGKKTATVEKGKQLIKIYQGGSLIATSRVSTGKYTRSTPVGTFRIGAQKEPYHSSAKYDDAPMPWAVHITGNIFIHGGDVPNYPASHGCIRLPDDAARSFYNWVEPGTMVTIRE